MGSNKLLMNFCGKPLIEWIIETVKSISFEEIILVYKDENIKKIGDKYKILSLYNDKAYKGQSESIKVALKNEKTLEDGYMFFVGDQPLLSRESILALMKTFKEKKGIVVPRVFGENKSPVIFSKAFKEELLSLEGDKGGREVIKRHKESLSILDFTSSKEFFDIDTKEELEFLRRRYNE